MLNRHGGTCFSLDSVGINRRGVVNERVIQERSSDHPNPEPCEAVVRLHLKRWTGAYAGWVLSSENGNPGSRRRQPGRKAIERCAIARARRGLRSRRPHARIETGRPLGRARTERPRGYPRSKGGGW